VLDRALRLASAPDVESLLTTFGAAVDHLRALAAEATALGVDVSASEPFADPKRVTEAEGIVAQAREHAAARDVPNANAARGPASLVDAESWVLA